MRAKRRFNGFKKRVIPFVLSVSLLMLQLVSSGCGWGGEQHYHIGILVGVNGYADVADGFMSKMKTLGLVEGKNVTYRIRHGNGDVAGMKSIVREFVAEKVDLIVAVTHGAAVTAKAEAADSGIPVLFAVAMVREGELVDSIAVPGGNITGVRFPLPDQGIKRFEFLLELKPQIKRIMLIYKNGYSPAIGVLEALRPVAASRGVDLAAVPVDGAEGIAARFREQETTGVDVDALQILPEPISHSEEGFALILAFSRKHRIPIAGITPEMLRRGAVFSYNPDDIRMGELAAPLAVKILNGVPAGTIPVVSPELNLRINYKVAQELGLKVPEDMLKLAIEIIR